MARVNITYDDPDTLNRIVPLLRENNCQISATLEPIVLLETPKTLMYINFERMAEAETLVGRKLTSEEQGFIAHIETCYQLDVWPFAELKISPFRAAGEIDRAYESLPRGTQRNWRGELEGVDEKLNMFGYQAWADPTHHAKGSLYSKIHFEERGDAGDRLLATYDVQKAKEVMLLFIKQGYRVIGLSGILNPRIETRDHYYDQLVGDMSFSAWNGHITFEGVPESQGSQSSYEYIIRTALTGRKPPVQLTDDDPELL